MPVFYSLCSSSSGNSAFIGDKDCGILIDAGIGIRNLSKRMELVGLNPSAIKAVFITHEHGDHINGLKPFTEKYNVPVFSSFGTLEKILEKNAVSAATPLYEVNRGKVDIGCMEVRVFHTPHDSAESIGIKVTLSNGKTAAICTDLGHIASEVAQNLEGCDFVMLESNYDETMLRTGPYHQVLKNRISSKTGHLSNDDCAKEIGRLAKSGVRNFVLGHLSAENNRPETALETTVKHLAYIGAEIDKDYSVTVALRTGMNTVLEI